MHEAALERLEAEVGFPVIATTAAVVAVLMPLSLMSGDTGRLFREFAICVAVAVSISTFVALTLVPMLCSRFLVPWRAGGSRLGRSIERGLGSGCGTATRRALSWSLRHRRAVASCCSSRSSVSDRGVYYRRGAEHLPAHRGPRPHHHHHPRARGRHLRLHPPRALARWRRGCSPCPRSRASSRRSAWASAHPRPPRSGIVFTSMTAHWAERDGEAAGDRGPALSGSSCSIPEAMVFAINPPSLSRRSRSDVEIVIKSSEARDLDEFAEVNAAILAEHAGGARARQRRQRPAPREPPARDRLRPRARGRHRRAGELRSPRACGCSSPRAPPTTSSCATSSTT